MASTVFLVLGTVLLLPFSHVRLDYSFYWIVAAGISVMQALSLRYRKQQEWELVAALNGASLLAGFSTVYAVTQYLLPEHNPNFWDESFHAFDAALGVTADEIVRWSRSMPWLDAGLSKIYYAFFFHFALFVPYAAGVRRDVWRSYETLANMFVCAIFGLFLFGIFPAKNAVFFYGHEDIHHTRMLVEHLELLRTKTFGVLTHTNAQGLIQFPSFHVAIAVLLGWDLRYEHRIVQVLGVVWTALMALSAVTTGGHYVIDIWGGFLIAIGAIWAVRIFTGSKPEN